MNQLNLRYRRSLCFLLCLLGNTFIAQDMKAQEIKAQTALEQPLQDRGLQAQLPSVAAALQLRNIQVGADGLVLTINGNPQISSSRVVNPDRVIIDLQTTEVPPWLQNSVVAVNRYGVRQIRIGQFQKSPAIARLVFDLDGSNPVAWQSTFDPSRGLLLLRPTGSAAVTNQPVPSLPLTSLTTASNTNLPATIDGLTFNGYGQLVIQANQAIAYRSNVDLANNTYSFTIPAVRISSQLRRPVLGANSPIEQIRLNQVGDSVVVTIKTIAGWQIQETVRTNPQAIALQLNSFTQVAAAPTPITNVLPNSRSPQVLGNKVVYGNSNGRQVVVIDAGHGGGDVGATRNGIYEKDIVLTMSKQLGRILQQMGYSVIYTRTEDIELDLEPRVDIAESARASAFVSVHANALDAKASQVNGVETYHAPGASLGKSLAEFVHAQILASTGADDRGVRSARFHVILKTSMPAVLVETGFITNPSEAAKLVDSAYQLRMAEAIARGVDQFLKSYR
ncbi:MAG: N-acetylmuramoyl-L-alanine amidase [Pseudanabaena sp. ELA645]